MLSNELFIDNPPLSGVFFFFIVCLFSDRDSTWCFHSDLCWWSTFVIWLFSTSWPSLPLCLFSTSRPWLPPRTSTRTRMPPLLSKEKHYSRRPCSHSRLCIEFMSNAAEPYKGGWALPAVNDQGTSHLVWRYEQLAFHITEFLISLSINNTTY